MSFDLAVWHEPAPILASQAVKKADALWQDDVSGFTPHPQVGQFYAALMQRFPGNEGPPIEWVEEHGVWSVTPTASDAAIIMSIVWPRANEVRAAVEHLAAEYDLICFNPQDSSIVLPPRLKDVARVKMYSADGSMAYEPDRGAIDAMLGSLSSQHWFAILELPADAWFIQCAFPRDGHRWLFEYRAGSPDSHYTTEVPVAVGLSKAFEAFGQGDLSWRDQYQWTKLDLG